MTLNLPDGAVMAFVDVIKFRAETERQAMEKMFGLVTTVVPPIVSLLNDTNRRENEAQAARQAQEQARHDREMARMDKDEARAQTEHEARMAKLAAESIE